MQKTYNAPFHRTPIPNGEAVWYKDARQAAEATSQTIEFDERTDDGILTTEDFARDLPQNIQLTAGVLAIILFFYIANQVGDVGTIVYLIGLAVVYYFRKQWRWADAQKEELEYYGKLRFPIFIIQTDKRMAQQVIGTVEPLEQRFKGISVFYSNRVLKTANHYREMLKRSKNQVLTDADVIEIYYQDTSTAKTAIETFEEYAVRASSIVIDTVGAYKSRLAALKDSEWVKKYFYNQ